MEGIQAQSRAAWKVQKQDAIRGLVTRIIAAGYCISESINKTVPTLCSRLPRSYMGREANLQSLHEQISPPTDRLYGPAAVARACYRVVGASVLYMVVRKGEMETLSLSSSYKRRCLYGNSRCLRSVHALSHASAIFSTRKFCAFPTFLRLLLRLQFSVRPLSLYSLLPNMATSRASSSRNPPPAFECGKSGDVSAAALPICPEPCSTCASQYLPFAWQREPLARTLTTHNDEEAAAELQKLTATIYDNLAFVKDRIQQHGDTLLKRWQKRTAEKRANLLLAAVPHLSRHKWAAAHVSFDLVRKIKATVPGARRGGLPSATIVDQADLQALEALQRQGETWLLLFLDVPSLCK